MLMSKDVQASRPELDGAHVVVAGVARSGVAATRALVDLGADVTVVDEATHDNAQAAAQALREMGARVVLGAGAAAAVPEGTDLVVASPGWPPHSALLVSARETGTEVWGEVELAWRLRGPDAADWLVVTGTNGKTTVTRMLESMLAAAGLRTRAVGNIGVAITEIVTGHESGGPYDVLAVELGSPQLETVRSLEPHSAALLNVDTDHIDFHGSMDAYVAAKRRAFHGVQRTCVFNEQDRRTADLVGEAVSAGEVADGARTVGFTLGPPSAGLLGVQDGVLVDQAFDTEPVTLASVTDVEPAAPHNVANGLAAAALARSYGVSPRAVRDGLRGFVAEPHRIADVGTVAGVAFVDDSKATNVHAATTSLAAYPSVVWVAGGLAKGGTFDDLVQRHADRLRGVVLLGQDREVIADALRRHAPEVPRVTVEPGDTGPVGLMEQVVATAARLARPGDTVLLAPACASWDQFADYTERGRLFASAVRQLAVDSP